MAEADYQKFCIEFARVLQEDLSGLLGASLRVRGPEIHDLAHDEAGDEGTPLVSTPCDATDDSGRSLCVALPRADAVTFAGLLMALEADDIKTRRESAPDDEILGAIGEVMNTTTAILSRVCETNSLSGVKGGELAVTDDPRADTAWIGSGRVRRARWTVGIPDYPDATVSLLVPTETLEGWFGEAVGEAGPVASAAPLDDGRSDEGTTLVVIDPSEADREAIEELEDAIGLGIWAIDPKDLSVAGFAELEDARGIVIAWEQRHTGGLEILHALREHPTTACKRIAMTSGHPTRERVVLALRHGADGFVVKPWDAEEVRTRFRILDAPGSASEGGDAESEEAEAEGEEAEAKGSEAEGEEAEAEGSEAEADSGEEASEEEAGSE